MSTTSTTLINIDREFDEVYFNEAQILRVTKTKQHYIDNPDKLRRGEKNPFYGRTHSEATRKYLSENNKGKQAGEKNPMFGRTHTEEVKQKSRERNKARFEIHGGGTFLGKKHSEQTRKIMKEKRGTRATRELKPCYAIDPSNNRTDFISITECAKNLGFRSLIGNGHKLLPADGSLYKPKSGKFKGWTFARII